MVYVNEEEIIKAGLSRVTAAAIRQVAEGTAVITLLTNTQLELLLLSMPMDQTATIAELRTEVERLNQVIQSISMQATIEQPMQIPAIESAPNQEILDRLARIEAVVSTLV